MLAWFYLFILWMTISQRYLAAQLVLPFRETSRWRDLLKVQADARWDQWYNLKMIGWFWAEFIGFISISLIPVEKLNSCVISWGWGITYWYTSSYLLLSLNVAASSSRIEWAVGMDLIMKQVKHRGKTVHLWCSIVLEPYHVSLHAQVRLNFLSSIDCLSWLLPGQCKVCDTCSIRHAPMTQHWLLRCRKIQ